MPLVEYGLPVQIPESLAAAKPELISQGAEALVFVLPTSSQIAKYRPPKPWRLPELDKKLRKRRTTQEARVLEKLAGFDVGVPHVGTVDVSSGLMYMERISGRSLKQTTWDLQTADGTVPGQMRGVYRQLGAAIARMHHLNIVHGDLTTSNAMVTADYKVVLIDFGLSSQSASSEDKAVDLYVLERAIQSTHPREAEELMRNVIMPEYVDTGAKLNSGVHGVLDRLEQVRRRGRKRTQLG